MPRGKEPNPDVNSRITDANYDTDKKLPDDKNNEPVRLPENDPGFDDSDIEEPIPVPDEELPPVLIDEPVDEDDSTGDVNDLPQMDQQVRQ